MKLCKTISAIGAGTDAISIGRVRPARTLALEKRKSFFEEVLETHLEIMK